MPRWIATCRRCGACAPDLAALPAGAPDVVRSERYERLTSPREAAPFLRWAMLRDAAGDRAGAAEATLHGAWALDDAGDGAAAGLRREAARLWDKPDDLGTALRVVDVWRRAGEFARAESYASDLAAWALDEESARILAFQQSRIAERDAGRHLISSALRPPARTPHVAHGRLGARGGFWRRLRGR